MHMSGILDSFPTHMVYWIRYLNSILYSGLSIHITYRVHHRMYMIHGELSVPSTLHTTAVQRTGSHIGDLSRNYAYFAKLVACKGGVGGKSCLTPISKSPRAGLFNQIELA